MTLKVEGLYVNLGGDNRSPGLFAVNPAGDAVSLYSARASGSSSARPATQLAVVRAGLNDKFGAC